MTPRTRAVVAVGVFATLVGGVSAYSLLTDEITETVLSTDPASEYQSPPLTTDDGGVYAFMATQPDTTDVPVTYDPCETIRVVVNEDRAPDDADDVLDDALEQVTDLTGLAFDVVGTTDEDPLSDEIRDGDDWRPVQITWTDVDTVPELEGDVAGLGGSTWIEEDGHRRFVTGDVVLDAEDLEVLGSQITTMVLLHELGHLVGLAHVDSTDELMHPSSGGPEWGPGDLVGLEALGQGRCA
ncbi:matrixin family metalloprotease [Aeromicrobium alkaliterrae]|uniref:Peptidase M10 metallopeptidase domain-containing protein n=1 Tax=Aeromicrobium alkaliterrae TaxID=302168 RepID=A0ABN2JYW5_9ACTN